MVKTAILTYDKETDGKLRWSVRMGKDKFKVYVPKEHVPMPHAERIRVTVATLDEPNHGLTVDSTRSPSKGAPIHAVVDFVKNRVNSGKYRPTGNPSEWKIGSPYIPFALETGEPELLQITIEWLS